MLVILTCIIFVLVAMVIGVPLLTAFMGGSLLPLALFSNMPLDSVVTKMFASANSFSFLAVPFFMICGGLLDKGGIARRLVDLAKALVGWLPGSLAVCTFLASAFFGAVSGSAVATIAAIGGIMLPLMLEDGYPLRFALATVTVAGFLGIIIPPSIPMVLYGMTCGVSIADLFSSGFVPGILLTASMSVYAVLWGMKHPDLCTRYKFSLKGTLIAFKNAIWALFMPIIILGGIYSGFFTPTEAAVVACIYGLFVGFVVYRQLNLKKVIEILRASTVSTAIMMIIMCAVTVFAFVINSENAAQYINTFITTLAHNKFQFWVVITIILLILGALMDTPPAIMLVGTFIIPILNEFDVDPLVFGLVMIVNLGIGLNTPPVGSGLFMAKTLRADITTKDLLNIHLLIYILICIGVMILLMACPQLITVVPSLFN